MTLNFKKTGGKCGKILLFTSILSILLEMSSAQRKIDCRKYVFAPPCRGIAAKRDTESSNNYRYTNGESGTHFLENQKIPFNENFVNMDGLMGLLKKVMTKNVEYDSNSNYLT